MNYYQISPLTRIPLGRDQFFTYSCTKSIPIGSLVEVPLGTKKVKGIVWTKTKKPRFRTRLIISVLDPSLLTKKQLLLTERISEYYLAPLGVVLKFFAPKMTKKESAVKKRTGYQYKKIALTPQQKGAIKKITALKAGSSALLLGPASSGKTEIIMETVAKNIANKKQSLVLVPEIFLGYQELARYSARFRKEEIVFYHSRLKPSELTYIHNSVRSNKIKVIIATRAGMFLPFKDLQMIAIDEEQDLSYKQWDQNPHYHVRTVAQFMGEIYHNKIVFVSATPSLETYFSIKKTGGLIEVSALLTKSVKIKKPKVELIDIRKDYKTNDQIIFSKELKNSLAENQKKGKISCILVPSRGKSRLVLCDNCRKTLRCPRCKISLVHSGDYYVCLHCNFKTSATVSKCPACGSFRLVNVGFGTESVAKEIKTLYPNFKIAKADANEFNDNQKRENLFKKLYNNKVDVLVGTYAIAKGLDIKDVGLVVVLNTDNWAGQIDFKHDERWLGNLFQLAGRVNRSGSDQAGKCLIQTFNVENPALKLLKSWHWKKFLDEETKSRKTISYPPYKSMIKLTYRDKDKRKVEKTIKLVYNQLLKSVSKKVQVLPPYDGARKKLRDRWMKSILLKYDEKLPGRTTRVLKNLPTGWNIDIDPETIF